MSPEVGLVDALQASGSHEQPDHVLARGHQLSGLAMFVGTIAGGFLGQVEFALPFIVRSVLLVFVFVLALRSRPDMVFEPAELHLPAMSVA